jgi:site-specific recombinase XerD
MDTFAQPWRLRMAKKQYKTLTLRDVDYCIVEWLGNERRKSPNTQEAYRRDVNEFIEALGKPFDRATVADITVYQSRLSGNPKPATVARKISAIRSFYRYLNRIEVTNVNLAQLETPKVKSVPKRENLLTEKEVLAIIAASEPDRVAHCFTRLLYLTAVRVSEALAIRWMDFTPDAESGGAEIYILGKGDKDRDVFVKAELWDDICKLPNAVLALDTNDVVFPSLKDRHAAARMVSRLARAAKINKKVSPHSFRHACASHLLKNKANVADVKELLGHSSLTTTTLYAHPTGGKALTDRLRVK